IRLPFWVAAACSIASASYGLFVLPESLAMENRQSFAWRRANPVGSLTLLRSHRDLFGLGAVTFVQFLAFQALPTVFVLYSHDRYGWTPFDVGLSLTLVGALVIVVQGGLVKRFITSYGARTALLSALYDRNGVIVIWTSATD